MRCAACRPRDRTVGEASNWRFVGVFWIFAFLLWTQQHSIYRYIVTLELYGGLLVVGLIAYILRPRVAIPVAYASAVALIATTQYPSWGKMPFGDHWFEVKVPAVQSGALVLLSSDAPMSYVAPFFPGDARFVGINNNLVNPSQKGKFAQQVAEIIQRHDGPMYSLSHLPWDGNDALPMHDLAVDGKDRRPLATNAPVKPLELCLLSRGLKPAKLTNAVEYFSEDSQRYLITNDAHEIRDIDAGKAGDWARTGQKVVVGTAAAPGAVPICRFSGKAPRHVGAHLYLPRGHGCEDALGNSEWTFEGDVFYWWLPDARGECPQGFPPVRQLAANDSRHVLHYRQLMSMAVRRMALQAGWSEDDKPGGVTFCAPPSPG